MEGYVPVGNKGERMSGRKEGVRLSGLIICRLAGSGSEQDS